MNNIAGYKPCEGFNLKGEAIDNIEAMEILERALDLVTVQNRIIFGSIRTFKLNTIEMKYIQVLDFPFIPRVPRSSFSLVVQCLVSKMLLSSSQLLISASWSTKPCSTVFSNHQVHPHSLESESTFGAPHFLAHTYLFTRITALYLVGDKVQCLGSSRLLPGLDISYIRTSKFLVFVSSTIHFGLCGNGAA